MADMEAKKTAEVALVQKPKQDAVVEIDLKELFYRLIANLKWIVLAALLGAILAAAYTIYWVTPLYKATSTIYVVSRKDTVINMSDLTLGSALTQDYIKAFDMWEVQEKIIKNLDLPYTYTQLRNMLSVSNTKDTRMIDLTVTSADAEMAAIIANEYARVGCDFISESMSTDRPNIMSVALTPNSPFSPSIVRNTAIGFILGAMLACGIVFVVMMLDDKIKGAEDIRKYAGLYNLAVIPVIKTVDYPSGASADKRENMKK